MQRTQESILQIGPIKAAAERTHPLFVPPIVGSVLMADGACVLVFGAWSKKG